MLKCFEIGMYNTAANRLYYAVFYATSALLVNDGYEAHTHNGNLALLNLHYIKTNKIQESYGYLLRKLFRIRQDSDYDDYFQIERDDLKEFITPTKDYIEMIKKMISS